MLLHASALERRTFKAKGVAKKTATFQLWRLLRRLLKRVCPDREPTS